jgi:hypothetical protein
MADALLLFDGATVSGVTFAGTALGMIFAAIIVEGMPEGYKPPIESIDWQGYKARIRAENGVRLITEEEAGTPVATLANGIYGHTFSPAFNNPTPLFHRTSFQCFEMHKLLNGETAILGCVTKKVADLLNSGEFAAFQLYPEPYDEAVVPITLNFKHILRSNNRVSRNLGNYIEFDAKITR